MATQVFIIDENSDIQTLTKDGDRFIDEQSRRYVINADATTAYALDDMGFVTGEFTAYPSKDEIYKILKYERSYFVFNVEIKVDRDMVPGFGYKSSDWPAAIFASFMQNTGYHPSYTITKAEYVTNTTKIGEQRLTANSTKELDALIEERSKAVLEALNNVLSKNTALPRTR